MFFKKKPKQELTIFEQYPEILEWKKGDYLVIDNNVDIFDRGVKLHDIKANGDIYVYYINRFLKYNLKDFYPDKIENRSLQMEKSDKKFKTEQRQIFTEIENQPSLFDIIKTYQELK